MGKRARPDNSAPTTGLQGYAERAYGPLISQWNVSKRKKGRFPKKNVKNAWKRLNLNTKYQICRYQNLPVTSFAGKNVRFTYPAGFSIAGCTRGITGGGAYDFSWLHIPTTWKWPNYPGGLTGTALPVYAFNETAIGISQSVIGGESHTRYTVPFYRLVKMSGRIDNNAYRYVWVPQIADSNSLAWGLENGNTAITNEPTYQHAWTEFNIAFYGAANTPTDVTIKQVTFNGTYGPNRLFYEDNPGFDRTPFYWDQQLSEDTEYSGPDGVQLAGTAWDQFLTGKINHPLQKSVNIEKTKLFNTHWKDQFRIGNDVTINKDAIPIQVIKKYFLKDGVYTRATAANAQSLVTNNVVGVDTAQHTEYVKRPEYEQAAAFGHRHKDKWLLMYTTNFLLTDDAATTTAPTVNDTASFDLMVRSKWNMVN